MKAITFLVLLTVAIIQTTAALVRRHQRLPPFFHRDAFNWTATSLYDPTSEMCCGGTVHSGTLISYRRCCGQALFDQATETCCYGHVVTKPADNQLHLCCGTDQLFNPRTQLCCTGTNVFDRRTESDACCGPSRYNLATEFCCANDTKANVYSRQPNRPAICCGAEEFDPTTSVCCGQQTYRANETVCCGKAPLSKTDPDTCCDTYSFPPPYGPRPRLCCGNRFYPDRDGSLGCCGGVDPFDRRKEICCEGPQGPKVVAFDNKTADRATCCGYKAFDPRIQGCCIDVDESNVFAMADASSAPFVHCCGASSFDARRQVCCGRTLHDRLGTDRPTSCCGQELIDPTTGQACCGGMSPFNAATETCCGVSVLPAPEGSLARRACCFVRTAEDAAPTDPRIYLG